jgi:HSP20 family molecular chaperone IbpA
VTGDDATVELRDTPNRTWITTELPDRSLDDVRVSVGTASIRIQAEPSDESPGIDRTIALAENVDAADVAIVYDEPVLTVIVPNENP